MDNVGYNNGDKDRNAALFSEVNSIYAYQEPDEEDVELFVSPSMQSTSKWKQKFRVLHYFRFWIAVITWIGIKTGTLFFWILVPVLYLKRGGPDYTNSWMILLVVAGVGSFLPGVVSCWTVTTTVQCRRLYFGGACWLGSIILLSKKRVSLSQVFFLCENKITSKHFIVKATFVNFFEFSFSF